MSGFSKDVSIFFFETNYLITMLYFKFSAIAEFNGSTHINEQKS